MGNNSSNPQSPLSAPVRSNNAYFGSSPEVEDNNETDLVNTIRDLNLERLYSRNPELRPRQPQEKQEPQQLKSVVSLTNTKIKIIGKNYQIYVLYFELLSEAPGRLTITSNGEINSLNFSITKDLKRSINQKDQLCLPLPTLSNFTVEIYPDLEQAKTQLDEGFQFIFKHEFIFEISKSQTEFQILLKEQRVFTSDDKILSIPINSILPIENCFEFDYNSSKKDDDNSLIEFDGPKEEKPETPNDNNNLPCLICLKTEANTAIAECGHLVICDNCLCNRGTRLHHCPICNKPTSFYFLFLRMRKIIQKVQKYLKSSKSTYSKNI